MKTIIFVILITLTYSVYGQIKKTTLQQKPLEKNIVKGLSNPCLKDLLNVCSINCLNGNKTLNGFAFFKFDLKWGAARSDAAQSFQNAKYNPWMLDKIFILFYNSNEDWMKNNFLGLGVKANHSEELSKFLSENIDIIMERDSQN